MKNIFFFLIFAFPFHSMAQKQGVSDMPAAIDKVTLGIGGGFDYGGFGGNLVVYPLKNFGLFGGVGYAIAGVGYNFGAKARYISSKPTAKVNGFIMAMYGYNAAIAVSGASDLNKLFNGPTFGLGLDTRRKPNRNGYWSFALTIPIRTSAVDDYIEDLKNNHGVEFKNELYPLGFSIGYKMILGTFN